MFQSILLNDLRTLAEYDLLINLGYELIPE